MDNDPAGKKYTKKHIARAHQEGFSNRCALIPQKGRKKTDWNDLHLAGDLEPKDIERYRFHGDLHLAANAMEKGLLIWQRHGSRAFAVKHDYRTFWWELPDDIYAANLKAIEDGTIPNPASDVPDEVVAAKKSAKVFTIANCDIEFLYFQQNKLTDESWYYTRVQFPHGRHVIKNTFTGGQVAAAAEFKKRLLSIAPGALFSGNTGQLNWLVSHYLDDIKIVETTPFIGYSKEHKAWVFPSLAVTGGQVYERNEEDFFEIGNLSIKSLNQSLHLHIGDQREYRQ
ncbi:toprim domain-containing protein, partial [Telmatospirillum sp. J64-1]|uniref:toprim domain-containing protein n=1 Tax=Telmatospirillum sp. J64-1 TaxID=2502183 RepID=UPI00351B593E